MFTNEYILRGKHATYAKNLCESSEKLQGRDKGVGMIRFGIDLIKIAPLFGVIYGERKPIDRESGDRFTIQANAVIRQQEDLETIYRLVMLTDKTCNLTSDKLIERAFKDDEDEEKVKQHLELFNSYVRGGIEYLHNLFTTNTTTEDDYINVIKDIYRQFQLNFVNDTINFESEERYYEEKIADETIDYK